MSCVRMPRRLQQHLQPSVVVEHGVCVRAASGAWGVNAASSGAPGKRVCDAWKGCGGPVSVAMTAIAMLLQQSAKRCCVLLWLPKPFLAKCGRARPFLYFYICVCVCALKLCMC